MSLKEKMMNSMMESQFRNMSSEEKKQMMDSMMDKFFSTMSDEEKKEMMTSMMPRMMGGNPMMGMMSMMMGKQKDGDTGKMPWDMCSEMMSGFKETATTAKFATSELRNLFDEWSQLIEKEVLDFIKESNSVKIEDLVAKFNLSEESIKYLLSKLAGKNLIDYKV